VDIGVNISTVYNDCGNSVFGSIPNGNGTFTVTAPSSNTGTAYTTAGSVFSTAAYVADTYTISFVNNGGQTAYTIVGATSGQVVPAPPGTIPGDAPIFNPNMDLSFNGVSLHISGTPHVGDSFVIAPSNNDNVFNMLQDLITTLSTPVDATVPSQQAAMHQQLAQCSSSLYQASAQLRSYLSQVGTRGADIDAQVQLNGKTMTQQKTILGSLANSNMESVISNISQKNVEIQTTAGVYLKIQNMLLDLMKSMML
jgi:flagellar hook-associated protein 3 FlgL